MTTERTLTDRLKEHPLWMFGSGAAAMAAFVGTVVLPMTNAYLNGQIEAMKPAQEKLEAAQEQIKALRKEVTAALVQRDEAVVGNPFSQGVAYPNGLGDLAIGTTVAKVVQRYPDARRVVNASSPDFAYVTAKTGHPIFHQAAYYFSVGPNETVDSILYLTTDFEKSLPFLRSRLGHIFGPPTAELEDGHVYWKATQREVMELSPDGGLHVVGAGYVPLWARPLKPK